MQRYIDCPDCGGSGMQTRLEPDCCGRISEFGYCKADCAVPREVIDPCSTCCGAGRFEQAHTE
jgi:hypothetical protein